MYDLTHLRHPRTAPIPAEDAGTYRTHRGWLRFAVWVIVLGLMLFAGITAVLLWWGLAITRRNDTSTLQWVLWGAQWAFWGGLFFWMMTVSIIYAPKGDPNRGLYAFARANGMEFTGVNVGIRDSRPGMLLSRGKTQFLNRVIGQTPFDGSATVIWDQSRPGPDGQQVTASYKWQWAGYHLARPMPNILLLRRDRSDGVGRLPVSLSGVKELRMGGIFDDRWRTLVPQDYEQDIFQIITPDILEPLAREGLACDIEIIDTYVNIYNRDANTYDVAWWETLGALDETMRRLAAKRWIDRSVEGEVADFGRIEVNADLAVPPVAAKGRRLPWRATGRSNHDGLVMAIIGLLGVALAATYWAPRLVDLIHRVF